MTVKLKIIRTCAAGGKHLEAGTEIELDDKTSRELVSARRAVVLAAPIETRDPQIAIGDAADQIIKPPTRGRPPKVPGAL